MTPSLLDPDRARRAGVAATGVAARVLDPTRIDACVAMLPGQSSFEVVRWRPVSLALGDAGAAVVCAALDARAPGDGWDRVGHGFLRTAVAGLEDPAIPLSLFCGGSGVAAAACLLSRGGRRYRRLWDGLDRWLLPAIRHRSHRTAAVVRCSPGELDGSAYDLVSGLAGWCSALLLRPAGPDRDAALADAAGALAAVATHNRTEPGLAHGLAGPLAGLALVRSEASVPVPGMDAAIHRLAGHLLDVVAATAGRHRPTWCTGPPGIARALWLAGAAVDEERYRHAAVEGMLADLRRPVPERGYQTPTFCHGVAGHLLVTALFWWDTAEPAFRAAAHELCDHLLTWYEPASGFGFRDVERSGAVVDNPGLLCGAAGVALVLLAVLADQPPAWSRLFLLS